MRSKPGEKTYHRHPAKAESLLVQTQRLLRRFGLQPRKGLGQHFLIDEGVLELIIAAAGLTPANVVLEVGPGLGILTRKLVTKAGWVVAIELDNQLASMLGQVLSSAKNFTIINEDILDVDPAALLPEQEAKFPPGIPRPASYKVVANLPYYITALVLRHFLEASLKPQIMVVMVQKEVAETIVAKPGKMSLLSVSVQFYGRPEIVSFVPATCFYPVPEVDSAIVKISLYDKPPVAVADTESFFDLVRAGFSAPRKQIANALSQRLKLPKTTVLSLLQEGGIDSQRRAETLTLAEWVGLWQTFLRMRTSANPKGTG